MPLSKARNRERMRQIRLHKDPVLPKNIAGLKMVGNRILGCTEKVVQPKETIPVYNPATHKAGDRVLVKPLYGRSKRLVEVNVPEIDGDGNLIPSYD